MDRGVLSELEAFLHNRPHLVYFQLGLPRYAAGIHNRAGRHEFQEIGPLFELFPCCPAAFIGNLKSSQIFVWAGMTVCDYRIRYDRLKFCNFQRFYRLHDCNQAPLISDHQQSLGYEDGLWKGPGPPLLVTGYLCLWPLIFKKNFMIPVLSDLSVLMTT